jgi:hypothetical protein
MLETLKQQLIEWGLDWVHFKDFAERALAVSPDALHVIAGVFGQLLLVALLRTNLADGRPWALILLAELLNEWNDFRVELWPEAGMQWGEAAKDVGLTMLLPIVLLLLARRRPGLFGLK